MALSVTEISHKLLHMRHYYCQVFQELSSSWIVLGTYLPGKTAGGFSQKVWHQFACTASVLRMDMAISDLQLASLCLGSRKSNVRHTFGHHCVVLRLIFWDK